MKRMLFRIGLLAIASVVAAGCHSGNRAPRSTAYSAVEPDAGSAAPVYSAPVLQSPSPAYSPPAPGGAPAYGAPAPAGERSPAYSALAGAPAPAYSAPAATGKSSSPAYRTPAPADGGGSCH